ncbi:MAG: TPM domain-containing protein [Tepidisphaeraceae bacterium]
MNRRHFLAQIDDPAIQAAIQKAEISTTGKIHVYVCHHDVADPLLIAQQHFSRLGMDRTPHRNAVLIFVAPESHKFAIIGDKAVHEKCGDEFWSRVAGEMVEYFKKDQWTAALTHGIRKAGQLLSEHFPARTHAAK